MKSKYSSTFQVYLNSADALNGTDTTPHDMTFNLGSVYDTSPQLQRFADAPYCYVKVDYASIKDTLSGKGTVLIKMIKNLPNSLESASLSASNNLNLKSSNIIGVLPSGDSAFKSTTTSMDNTYVKCSNVFNGLTQIQLTDENGSALSLSDSKPAQILLCVYFEDDEQYYNII